MQPDPADYLRLDVPHTLGTTAAGASFATSSGDILEVECFAPGAFRLRVGPSTRADYGILVARAGTCEVAQRRAGAWTFTSGESSLEIMSDPLSILLRWKGHVVLRSITDERIDGGTRLPTLGRLRQGGLWSAAFALATGEPVYALGEQFGPLDKRGQLLHSHVSDAQGVNTGRAYKSAPFAWSTGNGRGAWGTFVHTPGTVTHGVGHPDWSHRSYAMMVEDEALDLFLFAGESPASIVDLYTQMTGRPAPVPRWSLGLWVSRASFGGADAALGVATRLRERKIPADVLMLDPATTYDAERGFDFTWDAERMSDAVGTLAKIKERDFRVCVTEHPHVSVDSTLFQDLASQQYLLLTPDGDPYVHAPIRSVGAGANALECGIVDFTNPDAYAWWRDEHASLFEDGVDVIASEFGEQVPDDAVAFNGDSGARLHNVYPLLYNRCVFEATERFAKPQHGPPIIWSRAGWAGSQRYPIGFAGAPQSDWEGFAASIRGGLSLGMSGNPYHSSDVGGFYGARPTPELFVRWLQAAVFFSHMRLNGIGEREPWTFGAEAEGIARKWLALRYRLIPYLERTIAQATRTGLPVSRAMPLAFPDSRLARDFETQFMCGDALLVAPIVREGGEVDIALPPGAWYDLNTRARYAGSQVLRYAAKLDQFPVFGREGFALPLGRAVQHTGEINADVPLEALWIFGKPAHTLEGFRQVKIEADRMAGHTVRAMLNVDVQVFGDASAVSVLPL